LIQKATHFCKRTGYKKIVNFFLKNQSVEITLDAVHLVEMRADALPSFCWMEEACWSGKGYHPSSMDDSGCQRIGFAAIKKVVHVMY
jgi:hypothetical protein